MTAEARRMLDEAMTEAEWQKQVVHWAIVRGWSIYHTHDSRRSNPGFPDICAVRAERLLFAELKREKRSPVRPEQTRWLQALGLTAAEVYLWRPSDWPVVRGVLQ